MEKLKLEKRTLAAELQKTQNLLKIQVDIDKQNANLYQQEIQQIQGMIVADNKKIQEMNNVITGRNQKLLTI